MGVEVVEETEHIFDTQKDRTAQSENNLPSQNRKVKYNVLLSKKST